MASLASAVAEYKACVINEDAWAKEDADRERWDEGDWFREVGNGTSSDGETVQTLAAEEERLREEWAEYHTYYGEFY